MTTTSLQPYRSDISVDLLNCTQRVLEAHRCLLRFLCLRFSNVWSAEHTQHAQPAIHRSFANSFKTNNKWKKRERVRLLVVETKLVEHLTLLSSTFSVVFAFLDRSMVDWRSPLFRLEKSPSDSGGGPSDFQHFFFGHIANRTPRWQTANRPRSCLIQWYGTKKTKRKRNQKKEPTLLLLDNSIPEYKEHAQCKLFYCFLFFRFCAVTNLIPCDFFQMHQRIIEICLSSLQHQLLQFGLLFCKYLLEFCVFLYTILNVVFFVVSETQSIMHWWILSNTNLWSWSQ